MRRLASILCLFGVGIFVAEGSLCTSKRGTCQNYKTATCIAGYEKGLCSGSFDVRCCKFCGHWCRVTEARYHAADAKCRNAGGKCMHSTNYCPNNNWQSGKCGGLSSRKCCLPRSASTGTTNGACNLVTYTNTYVKGVSGKIVRIDKDFKSAMDLINGIAERCHVTVMVTSSYRHAKQTVSGAIVTPAKKSNHMVGHAIDMNLSTRQGWCNSKCLSRQRNKGASCFTGRLHGKLRWGQSFNDPVHIDDRLNLNNPTLWEKKYKELQPNCK